VSGLPPTGEPTGTPPTGTPPTGDPADTLALQIGGGGDEPERLLHIARPVNGLVRLREWTSADWGTPLEREMSADALLNAIERAAQQRRRMNQELYRVRRWLIEGV